MRLSFLNIWHNMDNLWRMTHVSSDQQTIGCICYGPSSDISTRYSLKARAPGYKRTFKAKNENMRHKLINLEFS